MSYAAKNEFLHTPLDLVKLSFRTVEEVQQADLADLAEFLNEHSQGVREMASQATDA